MSIFENYPTASFRGIAFVLEDEGTDNGRKIVSHEFVNSDRRFVEDLGRIPTVFRIHGFVFGSPGFGERDALKQALNKKGVGILIHPVYGSVDVIAEPYGISSTMKKAGRFDFDMVFRTQVSEREPFISDLRRGLGIFGDTISPDQQNLLVIPPVSLTENPNFATTSQLAETAQDSRSVAAELMETLYILPTDNEFFTTISDTYKEGILKIRRVTATIEDDVLRGIGLTGVARLFKDPPGFLSNPEILFPELSDLYREISGAGSFDKWVEAGEDFKELFSLDGDTKRSRDISKSYGALVSGFQVNALVNAYQSAVVTDFNTVTELEDAEKLLDDQFKSIIHEPIPDSIINNEEMPELKLFLLEMRSTAKIIFTQKEQNTFKVVSFDPHGRSLLQTTYDLYESLDNLTIIANLNQAINATSPRGLIQVVEEQ